MVNEGTFNKECQCEAEGRKPPPSLSHLYTHSSAHKLELEGQISVSDQGLGARQHSWSPATIGTLHQTAIELVGNGEEGGA